MAQILCALYIYIALFVLRKPLADAEAISDLQGLSANEDKSDDSENDAESKSLSIYILSGVVFLLIVIDVVLMVRWKCKGEVTEICRSTLRWEHCDDEGSISVSFDDEWDEGRTGSDW